MLDEKDLQAIAALLDGKIEPISAEVASISREVVSINQEIASINLTLGAQQAEIANINMTLENAVKPQLQALAEGQKTILETLSPKSRVEALEEEVAFLKQIIKTLASDVNSLKKAQ